MTSIEITSQPSRLANVPIPIFAIGMGILGLGLCWRYAGALFSFSPAIGDGILIGGSVLSILAAIVQIIRVFTVPDSLGQELTHPVRGPLIAQPVVVVLLLAEAAGRDFPALAHGLLINGTILAVAITLWVMTRHYASQLDPVAIAPIWLVAPIALLISAILFAGEGERSIALLAGGGGVCVVALLLPSILTGLSTAAPPPPARPLAMIAVASLPLILIIYLQLFGVDAAAYAIFGGTLITFFLVLATVPRWMRVPFGFPWWACGMPPAALVLGIIAFAEKNPTPVMLAATGIALAGLTLVIAMLFLRTCVELFRGELFNPT